MSNTPEPSAGGFLVRYRRLIREGGFLLVGQGSAAIAGLIGIRLVTELAPQPVFGEANLLLGILLLGRNLFVGPISNAQLLFHARYLHAGRPGWFIKRIARTTWLATLAMVAVGFLAYLGWSVYRGQSFRLHLVGILILVALIETFKSIRLNALSAERRQARVAAWMGIEAWVWLATACAALLVSKTTEAYLLGQAVGAGLTALVFGLLLYPKPAEDRTIVETVGDTHLSKELTRYALPFVPLAALSWASNLGERYVIAERLGTAQAGLYTASYSLASRPIVLLGAVLTSFARPILFQAVAEGSTEKVRRVFTGWMAGVCGLGAASVVGFWLLGPWVAKLLLAEEYRAGAPTLFTWVALGYALMSITQVLELRLMSLGHSARLLLPTLLAAAANIGLAAVLVPRVGVVGGAHATVAAMAVQLISTGWALVHTLRLPRPAAPAVGPTELEVTV